MTSISTLVIVLVFGLLILGSLACQIYVASRVYQDKGSSRIILGIFWSRRTFINGWQRADELGIKDIMLFWSFLVGRWACWCSLSVGL